MASCSRIRPTGAEHHVHCARGCGYRVQVYLCLAESFVDLRLPGIRFDIRRISGSAASSVAAGFHAVAVEQTIDTLTRTRGRMSSRRSPSARITWTACHSPEIEAEIAPRCRPVTALVVHVFQKFDLCGEVEFAEGIVSV